MENLLKNSTANGIQNLAQQLGGLQSAASTQFTLLKQTTKKAGGLGVAFPHNEIDATPMLYSPYEADSESFWGRGQLPAAPAVNNLGVIDEAEDSEGPGEQETLTPERAFTTFLMHLGPPMVLFLPFMVLHTANDVEIPCLYAQTYP